MLRVKYLSDLVKKKKQQEEEERLKNEQGEVTANENQTDH